MYIRRWKFCYRDTGSKRTLAFSVWAHKEYVGVQLHEKSLLQHPDHNLHSLCLQLWMLQHVSLLSQQAWQWELRELQMQWSAWKMLHKIFHQCGVDQRVSHWWQNVNITLTQRVDDSSFAPIHQMACQCKYL